MSDDNEGVPAPTAPPAAATPPLAQDPAATAPPAKRKRGFESLGDMVRSLSVVMLIVFVVFFFAQARSSDKKTERDINPAGDIRLFTQVVPGTPVPGPLPARWRSNVSVYSSEPNALRIGYLTPANHYAEYDVVAGPASKFVADLTNKAAPVRTVLINALPWSLVQDGDGHPSLVRSTATVTVLVGSLRGNADLAELSTLAGALRPLS